MTDYSKIKFNRSQQSFGLWGSCSTRRTTLQVVVGSQSGRFLIRRTVRADGCDRLANSLCCRAFVVGTRYGHLHGPQRNGLGRNLSGLKTRYRTEMEIVASARTSIDIDHIEHRVKNKGMKSCLTCPYHLRKSSPESDRFGSQQLAS